MKANGQPIDEYQVRSGPVRITYSLAFEEEQARISEGLTFAQYDELPGTPEWITPNGPQRSKCHVLVRYRMSQYIPAVARDAEAREFERKRKSQ